MPFLLDTNAVIAVLNDRASRAAAPSATAGAPRAAGSR